MTYLRALLLLALFLGAGAVRAGTVGTWTNEYELGTSSTGAFTINYKGVERNVSISPYTMLDDQIWYYNANPKNLGDIETKMEQLFEIPLNSLISVAKCDTTVCPAGVTVTPSVATGTGTTSVFSSNAAFNYLAVKLGQGELFFAWADPQNSITLKGIPTSSISHYEAFVGPTVIATPLPGAALLFASAMLIAGGTARRRSSVKQATDSPRA